MDTNIGNCKKCANETDLIQGLCEECRWTCGKCESEKVRGFDDGQIERHFRTCPKRTHTRNLTQNLKTRLKEILDDYSVSIYDGDYNKPLNEFSALLSSELDLVVKALREAVENMITTGEERELYIKCSDRTHVVQEENILRRVLSAFDIKYKELQEKAELEGKGK